MAKKKTPQKLQIWIDARKKYHLTHSQIQMARELGLNPKKFSGYANHRQQKWKRPLGEYIEHLYFKRFKKTKPDQVISIEERIKRIKRKKEERRKRKRLRQESETDQPLE
ncbi:MAG TPA: hypothetical protein ENN19_04615 [Chloroflexi bacterium]|nr:hypothetical protein [Chloroflexota bacterium]